MSQAALKNIPNSDRTDKSESVYWISVEGRYRVHRSKFSRLNTNNSPKVLYLPSHRRTFSSEIFMLGALLIALQVADGVLTALGMWQFGIHSEGNGLLRFVMEYMGYVPALVITKTIAIAVIGALCIYASQVKWLKKAFHGVIALYVTCAVLPWLIILGRHFIS